MVEKKPEEAEVKKLEPVVEKKVETEPKLKVLPDVEEEEVAAKPELPPVKTAAAKVLPKPDLPKPEAVIKKTEEEDKSKVASPFKKAIEKPVVDKAPDLPPVKSKLAQPAVKSGMLASLVNRFRGKSKKVEEERVDVDSLDLSGVASPSPSSASTPVNSKKPITPAETSARSPYVRAENRAKKAKKRSSEHTLSGVSTAIAQKVERRVTKESNGPDVLDGRTQLVSLAPEDGTVFFEELALKYKSVTSTDLPKPAIIARDMANLDYLDLVSKACKKDLLAFSQLLGLHRVMSEANCNEWVADMNALRKGFGDAVLATVVSKYSVNECKEILNSVYAFPTSAAS